MGVLVSHRRGEILVVLRELLNRVERLQPFSCEGDADAVVAIADDARALLEHAVAEMLVLERLEQAPQSESDDSTGSSALWEELTPIHSPPRAADICFAAVYELRRAGDELAAASSLEDRLVAAETAARKLRRAIRAVLAAAHGDTNSKPPRELDRSTLESDLASAMAVRRLYAGFRRALRRPQASSPEAVLNALRYAAGALATLVASPTYLEVRASDRAMLRRLRERVFAWSRDVQAVDLGLQLLDDIWTAADLLRGINRRQELHAHDRRRVASLLGSANTDSQAWLTELESLFGLDDTLDALIERARQDPSLAAGEIRVRLGELF